MAIVKLLSSIELLSNQDQIPQRIILLIMLHTVQFCRIFSSLTMFVVVCVRSTGKKNGWKISKNCEISAIFDVMQLFFSDHPASVIEDLLLDLISPSLEYD